MPQTGPVRWAEGLRQLLVPIDSVAQHPDNANLGDLDAITESIRVNGYNAPIIADRNTGYIVAGNHRWHALKGLGAQEVPVVWTDMDPQMAKRYMIADNRTAALSMTDEAALVAMLKDLQKSELGLFGTGYDDDSLNRLLEEMATDPLPEVDGANQAAMGIFQVVVDFDDAEDERDELHAELLERFGTNARKVDL